MKKYNLLFLCILLANCTSSAQKVELEFNFPHCGESTLNSMKISKICATRDFIATPLKKQKKDWLSFLAAEGSSGYKGHNEIGGGIQEFKNQELDMKNHVWDFTNQDSPSVILRGYNSTVTGGTILKASLNFGSNDYFAPNFRTKKQINNSDVEKHGFYYAKFESNAVEPDNSMENLSLEKMSLDLNGLSFNSWGGGIKNSKIILDKKLFVSGSKAFILNNQLISRVKIYEKNKKFTLNFNQRLGLIDTSKQIFPDLIEDNLEISSLLYVKFSPDTVIDGNTFTLTKRNDHAYAIVLDHSPRVRIINNTFNGFKVPILMDQWSSIVDEKGNVINPDQFSGDVTMNRKGEIVRK